MLALFGQKTFMIRCLSKKLNEKQNEALFLDHPVFMVTTLVNFFARLSNSYMLYLIV